MDDCVDASDEDPKFCEVRMFSKNVCSIEPKHSVLLWNQIFVLLNYIDQGKTTYFIKNV